ncbi:Spc97/Spc98 family protein [Annulohypoxylon truncatum]|uniref:Spc97/Spc98 family protein n=1 Tax=Annulohypoxylon truncatum TaxID=327061 RepID=UPI0020084A41|nr:Spc97/Spc98 family protein [Annulohypoxylon truncatum]KAI1205712.1 Spc97/Spc98 family protein [Annulohypoxylon truncatum]
MADQYTADVFAFPDFDRSSKLLTLSPGLNTEFFHLDFEKSDKPSQGHIGVKPAKAVTDGFFKLPDSLAPPEDPVHEEVPSPKPLHDVNLHDLDVFDESWLQGDKPEVADAEYKTWDVFLAPDISQTTPLFLTEAGPGAYDAALKQAENPLKFANAEDNLIQTTPYLTALLALAFGRGSVFFSWDEKKSSFAPELDQMRISGHSSEVLRGIQQLCLECGNTTRFLSAYVQNTYKTHPGAARVAVAKSVDMTLLVIQNILGVRARQTQSLLQLQSLIRPIQSVLAYFRALIVKVSEAKTDEQTLSLIFKEARDLEHSNVLLSEIMREVLSRVSGPWAQFAEKWIGVKSEESTPLTKENPGNRFVKVENITIVDDFGFETDERDFFLDDARMPEFIPSEVAPVMFETGKTLRLLRTHHPEHPLCQVEFTTQNNPPSLRWHFDWKSIRHLQEDVKNYEMRMFASLQHWSTDASTASRLASMTGNTSDGRYTLEFFGQEEAQLERRLLASIAALDKPLTSTSEEDNLSKLLNSKLFDEESVAKETISDFSPHWSLIPFHSFGPLVAAQARIINREYMRLLFSAHQLRDHLSLQKQFHLLGNGVFCSRLSHALFDPNLDTAERKSGVALTGGVMGLRLTGRDTWPPASSELRLALMGVLAESYISPSSKTISTTDKNHDIPGDISFAVRDLSNEEIDKCLDPGSLEALDFLRLSYKPPAPLSPIFPPIILLKYDKVFKLLLRVLRMLYVTEQLFQNTLARTSNWHDIDNTSLRFRFEAQHFVTSITAYFFDTGIEIPWRRFVIWLDGVEDVLTKSEPDQGVQVLSPDEVREEHERMLDHIMHTLLLRKRQQPVMRLLEDIFSVILKFSKVAHIEASGSRDKEAQDSSPKQLYASFKKKVDVFMTVCHGLIEKGGKSTRNEAMTDSGKRGEEIKENTIDKLLLKLEMSGYYGHTRP